MAVTRELTLAVLDGFVCLIKALSRGSVEGKI